MQAAGEVDAAKPIVVHETSVYRVRFDADGDLWTGSADGTVKGVRRESGWRAECVLAHGDFVRDVVVDERGGWVVSGCRDEEVRVWDRTVSFCLRGRVREGSGLG